MTTYTHLLFDLDDTLLDFHADSVLAFNSACTKYALPTDESAYQIYQKHNLRCWKALEKGELDAVLLRSLRFEKYLAELDVKSVTGTQLGKEYLYQLGKSAHLIKGALDTVKQCIAMGYQLCVITNGLKEVQRKRITASGLAPYFDHIVVSDEIGLKKPQKAFFDYTIRKLGNPQVDKLLIIGDSLSSDIAGAYNAGITSCWFNYRNKPCNKDARQPTHTVSNHTQLQQLLK